MKFYIAIDQDSQSKAFKGNAAGVASLFTTPGRARAAIRVAKSNGRARGKWYVLEVDTDHLAEVGQA